MEATELRIGDLHVDTHKMSVWREGVEYKALTRTEYDLVLYLVNANGRPVNARELANAISGPDSKANTAEVYVKYVRSKLGRDAIIIRRGFGYVLAGAAS